MSFLLLKEVFLNLRDKENPPMAPCVTSKNAAVCSKPANTKLFHKFSRNQKEAQYY